MSAANQPGPMVQPGVVQEDPGKTLGMVGLILAIVANLIGLIVSIIAFRKSKAAGFNNGMAKAGIVVGAILTAVSVIATIAIIVVSVNTIGAACSELGPGVHQVGGTTVTCG